MGHEETWGVMSMSIFLIMVVASWMYKCVRTYQTMCFKYVQVIVSNFISIKLFLRDTDGIITKKN